MNTLTLLEPPLETVCTWPDPEPLRHELLSVLPLADSSTPGAVSLVAAQRAAAWCDYLESHACRIYQLGFNGNYHVFVQISP